MAIIDSLSSVKSKAKRVIPEKYHSIFYSAYYASLPLRGLLHKGNQLICPCCNGNFNHFLPVKTGPKVVENEKCPGCDSFTRHRVTWLYLKNRTNLFSERLKVLHMAPEYCFLGNLKNLPNLDYVTADLSSTLAAVKMDITNIPYEDNYFDVVLCSHVLEHIPDDKKAMKELLRVLKPSGWAILQVPIDYTRSTTFEDPTVVSPEERERLFWQHNHVRLYGCDYKDKLAEAGFTVKVDDYVEQLGTEAAQKYGLHYNEYIYFCTKN